MFVAIAVLGGGGVTMAATSSRTVRGRERVLLHPRRARQFGSRAGASSGSTTSATATSTSTTRPYLEFEYIQSFADMVDAAFPQAQPIDALHIGGGGFTMPRYLAAEYPGTQEHGARDRPRGAGHGPRRLGLRTSAALRVRIGDARIGIRDAADDSRRLRRRRRVRQPVGAVAPHDAGVHRRDPPRAAARRRLRAEHHRLPAVPFRARRARTLREQFDYVAAIAPQSSFDGEYGGNVVLVASDRAIDAACSRSS